MEEPKVILKIETNEKPLPVPDKSINDWKFHPSGVYFRRRYGSGEVYKSSDVHKSFDVHNYKLGSLSNSFHDPSSTLDEDRE